MDKMESRGTFTDCRRIRLGDAYQAVPILRGVLAHAVVIGGKTALWRRASSDCLTPSRSDIVVDSWVVYGNQLHMQMPAPLLSVRTFVHADMLFLMGGGRAIDEAKKLQPS